VQARPTPEKDSSSESGESAADADAHDDEFYETGPGTAGRAYMTLMASSMSAAEVC
jgi:hypothetical protein